MTKLFIQYEVYFTHDVETARQNGMIPFEYHCIRHFFDNESNQIHERSFKTIIYCYRKGDAAILLSYWSNKEYNYFFA